MIVGLLWPRRERRARGTVIVSFFKMFIPQLTDQINVPAVAGGCVCGGTVPWIRSHFNLLRFELSLSLKDSFFSYNPWI